MKLVRGYLLGIVLSIAVLIIPAKMLYEYLFSCHNIVCIFDSVLAESTCAELYEHIKADEYQNQFSLAYQLKNDFPFIKSVVFNQTSPRAYCCTIQACKPLFILSPHGKILLDNGAIVDTKKFIPEGTRNLFVLDGVNTKESMAPPALLTWFNTVPDEICDTYSIYWRDKTMIMLSNIQQPTMRLICDYKTVLNKQLLSQCSSVFRDAENLHAYANYKGLGVTADVRFKNQIVLCWKKGDYEQ